jgi:ABC-type transport system involved in multi-copper enzyme maturation permease subunit
LTAGFDPLWNAIAKLPFADRFEGARAVARREFGMNLKSFRMIVVALLMGVAIVGGSAGISAFAGGGSVDTANVFFAHPVSPPAVNGTYSLAVFASDVFGAPHTDYVVVLAVEDTSDALTRGPGQPNYKPIANATTDASGFVRFDSLSARLYLIGHRGRNGGFLAGSPANPAFGELGAPFSLALGQYDLDQNGSNGHLTLHATQWDGTPLAGATVLREGTAIASLDAHGFTKVVLPPGAQNISVTLGNESLVRRVAVREPAPTALEQGTDFIMLLVASAFVPFIVPIATIAVAHDAIAREKANGSIDFILSRPATRRGMLLGKFLGSTAALLVPVYVTLLLGALLIGALSGSAVTGSFLGAIFMAVTIYVASFALLLLILSTLAKTTGTAIMFGVLLWMVYNVLWNVVTFLVTRAAGLSPASPGYANFVAYTGLFNLNDLYSAVVTAAYPGTSALANAATGSGVLPSWAPLAAAIVWLAVLFFAALEVFERKAAE